MGTHHFFGGVHFKWNTTIYLVTDVLPNQKIVFKNTETDEVQTLSLDVLVAELYNGNLNFISQNPIPNEQPIIYSLSLDDYPTHLSAKAYYRLALITPFLSDTHLKSLSSERIHEIHEEYIKSTDNDVSLFSKVPSPSSVRRWINTYTNSGMDIRSLLPQYYNYKSSNKSRLEEQCNTLINRVIKSFYYTREKVSINDIYREILVQIHEENTSRATQYQLTVPSRATVARRIHMHEELYNIQINGFKKRGEKSKQHTAMTYPSRPLERVEIDHTILDIYVVDDEGNIYGRPTLTFAICMATRYPVGIYISFEPPSYLSVMECLYHCFHPKTSLKEEFGTENEWLAYGVPKELIVDRGREFKSAALQDACNIFGIKLTYSPPNTPTFKAGIERCFGTLNTGIVHKLPGTTVINKDVRGKPTGKKYACITLQNLIRIVVMYIVDIYTRSKHRSLGMTPSQAWEDALAKGFQPHLPSSLEDTHILLGCPDTRVIHHYGIDFESIRYNSSELASIRDKSKGKPVKIKYLPQDLSAIYIYDETRKKYIKVPALNQEYTYKLSIWKHRVVRKQALREEGEVNHISLGMARRKIDAIAKSSPKKSRSLKQARHVARWKEGGKGIGEIVTPTKPTTYDQTSTSYFPEEQEKIVSSNTSEIGGRNNDIEIIDSELDSITNKHDKSLPEGWTITFDTDN